MSPSAAASATGVAPSGRARRYRQIASMSASAVRTGNGIGLPPVSSMAPGLFPVFRTWRTRNRVQPRSDRVVRRLCFFERIRCEKRAPLRRRAPVTVRAPLAEPSRYENGPTVTCGAERWVCLERPIRCGCAQRGGSPEWRPSVGMPPRYPRSTRHRPNWTSSTAALLDRAAHEPLCRSGSRGDESCDSDGGGCKSELAMNASPWVFPEDFTWSVQL